MPLTSGITNKTYTITYRSRWVMVGDGGCSVVHRCWGTTSVTIENGVAVAAAFGVQLPLSELGFFPAVGAGWRLEGIVRQWYSGIVPTKDGCCHTPSTISILLNRLFCNLLKSKKPQLK